MKGITPLYMFLVLILLGATPLKKNKENPKGGVKKLVCKFSEIRIPNHKGLPRLQLILDQLMER